MVNDGAEQRLPIKKGVFYYVFENPLLFWCRGYYVDTVGRNQKKIEEYIRNQLSEDKLTDDVSRKELYDPFTGEAVVTGGKK